MEVFFSRKSPVFQILIAVMADNSNYDNSTNVHLMMTM